jgi:putative protein-disulfide isomerase
MNDHRLIYVWDAYCGWCYGFSKSLRAFYKNHPDIPLEVISGGLFQGDQLSVIGSGVMTAEKIEDRLNEQLAMS